VRKKRIPLATAWKEPQELGLRCHHALRLVLVFLSTVQTETDMKFRWSEWLTAAALVLTFSAFAASDASEQTAVIAETR
jgi:hypothetical protein